LLSWLLEYYPSGSGSITNLFLPAQIAVEGTYEPGSESKGLSLPPLTKQQSDIIRTIKGFKKPQSVLLHGETGTGKTRVYIELARGTLAKGKSVIMLTPEIGLTPQLAKEFEQVFPGQVVVYHSDLTPKKRREAWQRIASTREPLVVIGPRSALFSPLANVGLLVVDEAHERSYKQEQAPYYQTTRVAARLAALHRAHCIFGTATPLISDYYLLKQKGAQMLRLTEPAQAVKPPVISVVDLTDTSVRYKVASVSESLYEAIQQALAQKTQVLLFLNRRGSARLILCQACGWQFVCPHCDVPMVYHADEGLVRCHTCGFSEFLVTNCPKCGSAEIFYQVPGTKSVEQQLQQLLPTARIKRFDSDNKVAEKLTKHFDSIVAGDVDILVGTQMLTKGLHLPNLGVVGILNADTSLQLPDYTAEEQMFQMLMQVMGRAGRSIHPSKVIIQTHHSNNPALQAALKRDWLAFYDTQLQQRQVFGFPPFAYFLQLSTVRASRASAKAAAEQLLAQLRRDFKNINIKGPSPHFHEKLRGKYNWQIIVSAKNRQILVEIVKNLPSGWLANIDPVDLL
jgi:primosomal protein N' (replication factor Y)